MQWVRNIDDRPGLCFSIRCTSPMWGKRHGQVTHGFEGRVKVERLFKAKMCSNVQQVGEEGRGREFFSSDD